jgi:predicted nucleic acid-binding protein
MDSSAIIKRYVKEVGSTWIHSLFLATSANRIAVASITSVEVVAAITRRSRGGTISSSDASAACALFLADYASDLGVVEITDVLLRQAVQLAQSYGLRGYDAVQLAACRQLNRLRVEAGLRPIVFVSADRELNAAALAEGLAVEDPNLHP